MNVIIAFRPLCGPDLSSLLGACKSFRPRWKKPSVILVNALHAGFQLRLRVVPGSGILGESFFPTQGACFCGTLSKAM